MKKQAGQGGFARTGASQNAEHTARWKGEGNFIEDVRTGFGAVIVVARTIGVLERNALEFDGQGFQRQGLDTRTRGSHLGLDGEQLLDALDAGGGLL